MVALFGSLDSLLFSWSPCAWFVFCWFGWVFGCRLGSIVRVFFVRSSRKLSLLGEFPGGNQVDGLPPAYLTCPREIGNIDVSNLNFLIFFALAGPPDFNPPLKHLNEAV